MYRTWPVTSQSEKCRSAASCSLMLWASEVFDLSATQAAICNGSMSRKSPIWASSSAQRRKSGPPRRYASRVLRFRLCAAKNSRNRFSALAPAHAISAGMPEPPFAVSRTPIVSRPARPLWCPFFRVAVVHDPYVLAMTPAATTGAFPAALRFRLARPRSESSGPALHVFSYTASPIVLHPSHRSDRKAPSAGEPSHAGLSANRPVTRCL